MPSSSLPSYIDVEHALMHINNEADVAEIHGLLTGIICAGRKLDGKACLAPLLNLTDSNDQKTQQYRTVILNLYNTSNRQLQEFSFDFELLLPDDVFEVSQRAEALSRWCQGFMIAMKMIGVTGSQLVMPDTREALSRFLEIATLNYESIEIGHNDELAYFEITEYVRMAVILLYTELASDPGRLDDVAQDGVLH